MHFSWSQIEEAWRDLLVHKAERSAFDAVSKHHRFAWPKALAETSWRGALLEVAFGPRDLFVTLFAAAKAAFQQYDEVFEANSVSYMTGVEKQLYREDGWDNSHVYRFVQIGSRLYWSIGLYGASSQLLRLSPVASSYWEAADWDEVPDPVLVDTEIRLLPFRVYERQAGPTYDTWNQVTYSGGVKCTVEFILMPYMTHIPETFILDPTEEEYAAATPGTCPGASSDVCTPADFPNGGYLLDDDTESWDAFGENVAYPIYLYDGEVAPEIEAQLAKLAPAGSHVLLRDSTA